MPRAQLFDYDAAALLTGLSPETIRQYCDSGVLTRDEHFVVFRYRWKYGRLLRRVRLITPAGIDYLNVGRYKSPNARQRSTKEAAA